MTSRLRRMLLIDTRTSSRFSSSAINEIDPRGGAAVTGVNGAGKSTTLQLLPLFFGNLPREISESGGGRLPMLRYALPNPTSALVFEYQRDSESGSKASTVDGDDGAEGGEVCCVVLRRNERDDAPMYRFFKGPFRQEFFLTEHPDGRLLLADDVEFSRLAFQAGVPTSIALSSPQYRNVMLGLASSTHMEEKLKAAGREFSYASRSLPNLDRLVTAVVKEKVDFRDFVAVAVTIIQSKLGKRKTAGTLSPSQITLHQSVRQIGLWLSAISDCKLVLAQKPATDVINDCLSKISALGSTRRRLVSNLQTLRARSEADVVACAAEREVVVQARTEQLQAEVDITETLAAAELEANHVAGVAKSAADAEESLLDYFIKQGAEPGVVAVAGIPGLRAERQQLLGQRDMASSRGANIQQACTELINKALTTLGTEKGGLSDQRDARVQQHEDEIASLNDQETQDLLRQDEEAKAPIAANTAQQTELVGALAVAKDRQANPSVPQAINDRVEATAAKNLAATNEHGSAVQAQRAAQEAVDGAQRRYDVAEAAYTKAVDRRADMLDGQKRVQDMITPADGTLLSRLRAAGDDPATGDLARILSPDLLTRSDLNPRQVVSDSNEPALPAYTAYGWALNTEAIDVPGWADVSALRVELERWVVNVGVADAAIADCKAAIGEENTLRLQASSALELSKAETSRRDTKLTAAGLDHRVALSDREAAVSNLVRHATDEFRRLDGELKGIIAAGEDLVRARDKAKRDIAAKAKIARAGADTRKKAALLALTDLGKAADERQKAHVEALEKQRDQQMSEAGVSVEAVAALTSRIVVIEGELQALHDLEPIVNAWKKWLAKGGRAGLDTLQRAASSAADAAKKATAAVTAHKTLVRANSDAFDALEARFKKRSADSQTEIVMLSQVAGLLQVADAALASKSQNSAAQDDDLPATAADLQVQVRRYQSAYQANDDLLRSQYQTLKSLLTRSTSSVSTLVQTAIDEARGQEVADQAERLLRAVREVEREILPTLNVELNTMASAVFQFEQEVLDFNSAVTAFNTELRTGIQSVSQFDSIKSFDVTISSDLSGVGFWGDIAELRRAGVGGRMPGSTRSDVTMPTDETIDAMRKLMRLIEKDDGLEFDMHRHISLSGQVEVNGERKQFNRESDLSKLSSNGLNMIILVTLLSGMLNTLRGTAPIHVPWVTDEIGRLDASHFARMMKMLKDNRIDVITASPDLSIAQLRHFARRYRIQPDGSASMFLATGGTVPSFRLQPAQFAAPSDHADLKLVSSKD